MTATNKNISVNSAISSKFLYLGMLIGNTPLAEISLEYKGRTAKVYAKLEAYNYSGSIKDRIAFHMLKRAYEQGRIMEGDIIAEGTSGNTGIALAAIGAYLGHKVTIFMPEWMTLERINLIKSLGAEIRLITKEQGGFSAIVALTSEYAAGGGVFLTGQFANADNVEAHALTTGPEILRQMHEFGRSPDAFVAGVGTGGTLVGVAKSLKEANSSVRVYPIEPDNSLLLSGCARNEQHFIYGIGDGFIPAIMKNVSYDGVITVNQEDSVLMVQALGRNLGLGVGISSGANLLGAVKVLEKEGFDKAVVTVFADDSKKYLSSEYIQDFEMQENYITKDIRLLDMKVVR